MEVYSSSVEDQLIDGLSFKLAPGSSYIQDRKSATYWPSGSNIYTPNGGTKVIRVLFNGSDWPDPNTLRIFFDVTNLEAYPLRVLGNPFVDCVCSSGISLLKTSTNLTKFHICLIL